MMRDFDEAVTTIGKMQTELIEKDSQIRQAKILLTRAADALEAWHEDQELSFDSLRREEQLVVELRKAAQ